MIKVRPLTAADEPAWRPLWAAYLRFYETELDTATTAAAWSRLLKGDPEFGLVAELDGELVGIAHCLLHPTTWSTKNYCYLSDLFVAPAARAHGAGRALIEAVYAVADARGCGRVYWTTHKDNAAARSLYDRLASVSEFVQYRR